MVIFIIMRYFLYPVFGAVKVYLNTCTSYAYVSQPDILKRNKWWWLSLSLENPEELPNMSDAYIIYPCISAVCTNIVQYWIINNY